VLKSQQKQLDRFLRRCVNSQGCIDKNNIIFVIAQ
jgi:hypothetical protein